jgi:uncharacterized membrane-anchored protein
MRQHPLRQAVQEEIHSRPFPVLQAPFQASHLAVLAGETGRDQEWAHLGELCRAHGVEMPGGACSFFAANLGKFDVRWERHTEFFTYTFIRTGPFSDPFEPPAISLVPPDWLAGMSGGVVTALHVAMQSSAARECTRDELHEFFDNHRLIGSQVVEQNATVWTALRNHADGFGRWFIHDHALTDYRAGRLLQRILELEAYRTLSLLALPEARDIGSRITQMDESLEQAVESLASVEGLAEERKLLKQLSLLAGEAEQMRTRSCYRFGATRAYHAIVQRRLEELRETQVTGIQTVAEFLDRRMSPAIRTCISVGDRVADLSRRVDRASDLLRTRIDLTLEAQNQELLIQMNRRAQMQLWLQQMVEDLSIVAISYYMLGLIKFGLAAAENLGVPIRAEAWTGASVPVVIVAVWLGMRRMHKRIEVRKGHEPI